MLIIRDRREHVEILTLNRPEAANSLNPALLAELGQALHEILEDDDIGAVVLTGAGDRVFCAGMDLTAMGDISGGIGDSQSAGAAAALASFMVEGSYRKPIVAAVNGAAVGGGLEILLACDIVVAAEHARFGLPEVKRGLFAAGGGTLLSTRIPLALALEYGLTGRYFEAPKALEMGLINRVVPLGEELAAAVGLAEEVAANGPLAVQLTKRLMRAAVADGPTKGWATPEQSAAVFKSDDAREGAMAFMGKRPAAFTGR